MTVPTSLQLCVGTCIGLLLATAAQAAPPRFQGKQAAIPAAMAERMRQWSWRPGCPVDIAELVHLRISHWGRDGAVHPGDLIVHREVAAEVLEIFRALFERKFPIEKMRLIDDYQGDDDRSMADNNTSGFNCRPVPGKPLVFSKHSYGRAVDLNPLWNPMVVGETVVPAAGAAFAKRGQPLPGVLRKGDPAVSAFVSRGWTWGGDWIAMKDYQHFQK